LLENGFEEHLELQKRGLRLGGEKAARYLSDDRFETLVDAFESSMDALPQAIASYQSLMSGWNALQDALGDRSYNLENIGVEPA
jgi:hypothetical protein